MSSILKFKRGTTAEIATAVETLGELVIDTSKKTVVVMDGTTPGGTPLATTALASSTTAGLMSVSDKTKLNGLSNYALPTASTATLGGVKVDGSTITINNGIISASAGNVDLSAYYTSAQTDSAISSAVSSLATISYVDTAIANVSGGAVDLSNYYTKSEVDTAIAGVSAGAPDLTAASITDLGDIDTTTTAPTNGQALIWNGTSWVPGDVAPSVDLTPYARKDSYNQWTGSANVFTGPIKGKYKYEPNGGDFDGNNRIDRFILQSSTDQGLTFSPMFVNDLGFGYKSGRIISATVTHNAGGTINALTENKINELFDAGLSYYSIGSDSFTNDTDEVTLTVMLDTTKGLKWSAIVGVQFTNTNFNPKYSRLEVYKETSATWEQIAEDTAGNLTNYLTGSTGADGTGITGIRVIMRKDPAVATSEIRIQSIFAVEANSVMGDSLFVSRNGGNIYGNLDVQGAFTVNGAPVTGSADLTGYATEVYVDNAVAAATGADLSAYYTSAETDAAITSATSGLATTTYVDDAVAAGGGSVDLTPYARKDSSNTFTQNQVFAKGIEGVYPGNSQNVIKRFIQQSSPAEGISYSPALYNDLGHGIKSGRVTSATVSHNNGGTVNPLTASLADRLFDGSTLYYTIQSANSFVDATDRVIIDIALDPTQGLKYGTTIGIEYASKVGAFGASYTLIEAYKETDAAWFTVVEDTTGTDSNYVAAIIGSDGTGITAIRITIGKDPAVSTNDVRISRIFAIEANSKLAESLYVSRAGGDVYGDLNIEGNFTVNGQPVSGSVDLTGYATESYVDSAVAGVSGGSGASTVRAVFNPEKSAGVACTVVVQAEGAQADVDALTVTVSGDGSTITIANVAAGLKLKSVNFHAPFAFNTTTGMTVVYPESYGATTLPESVIPTIISYTGAGVLNATSATSVANNSGNMSATKGNLSASTEQYLVVKMD